jgi:hypothetical protein
MSSRGAPGLAPFFLTSHLPPIWLVLPLCKGLDAVNNGPARLKLGPHGEQPHWGLGPSQWVY